MADNIDKLTAAIEKLNGNFNAFQNVMQQNIMQRQDGKGRYPGYTPFFGGENSLEKALKELERAQRTSKNAGNFGARLLGLDDVMYKGEQIKRFREDVEETKKTLEDINKEIEKSQKEYKNLEKQLGKNKKLIEDVIDDYHDLLDTGKEKSEIDDELINKYGITKSELDDIISKEGTLNALKAKGNDLQEEELKKINTQTKLYGEQANLFEQKYDSIRRGFNDIKQGGSQILRVGKQFADAWMKVDTASANFARSIGIGGRGMEAMRKNAINSIASGNLAMNYGVGMEDLLKLRQGYTTSIGRNISLSSKDQENAVAMSVVMGEKGGQLATSLENFGLSYSEAAKTAGKMYEEASKYGLSFEKYSDNFLQNIKMAQNYTFKNGLKGLESMARKATAIKLDMQQIANFADKVGTLQGAVETSAQLQVLGGPFAQFANPLQMLNESMTDMEGLMDRFTKMVGGLGRFDATTGQVNVSAFNKQRVRAAAQAMGMDYNQVMETIQAQGRADYIGQQIANNTNLTDEEKQFIKNTASVSGGTAHMTYFDRNGKEITKNVNEMTSDDIRLARAQNQSQTDNIRDIAKDTRTLAQQLTGVQNKMDAVRAKALEKVQKPISKAVDLIGNNVEMIVHILTAWGIGNGIMSMFRGGIQTVGGLKGGFGSKSSKVVNEGDLDGKHWHINKKGNRAWGNNKELTAEQNARIDRSVKNKNGLWNKTALGSGAVTGGQVAGAGVFAGAITGLAHFAAGDFGKAITKDDRDNQNKALGDTIGSTAGAALGMALGGPMGAMIGQVIGGTAGKIIGGAITKGQEKRRSKKREELAHSLGAKLSDSFKSLEGDYSVSELKNIKNALQNNGRIDKGELSDKLLRKMYESGDADKLKGLSKAMAEAKIDIDEQQVNANTVNVTSNQNTLGMMANGGILRGPSHARGGMKIQGSNVEVEGGEFVVNKQSTARHLGELNRINSDKYGNGGIIKPRKAENGGMLTVLPMSAFNKQRLHAAQEIIGGQNKPIEVNINGTLKLDAGNGINKDILGDLVKNPVFIRQITKLIEQQMTINNKGGNVINKGLYNAS